jgi:phosphoribosylformylglycinamidine synthase
MVTPRAWILRTAGTNCDEETEFACRCVGFDARRIHIGRLLERPEVLREAALLVIPGGFTYGDDLGAGRILANEVRLRLGDAIRAFLRRDGMVLGICNGFQVLVKAGILPDPFRSGPPEATLTYNDSARFEARWIRLRAAGGRCVFWPEADEIELPVAHGEGKFVARSDDVLDRMERAGQVVFRYAAPDGGPARYPWNPNGSARDIAAVCDPTGRAMGMMPHPERYVDATHHPRWTRGDAGREPDGLRLFRYAARACR